MKKIKMNPQVINIKRQLWLIAALLMFTLNIFAHSWEIRVAQNQNGTLTWWSQSYHANNSCGIANSGIVINGVNYQFTTGGAGSIIPFASYVFTNSTQYYNTCAPNAAFNNACGSRQSWASVTTPYIAGALNVQVFSPNSCFAPMPDMPAGNGAFSPPPPPICTSCPITSWTNTIASPGNNNGTPCSAIDDYTSATITINHLACASITGTGKFNIIFDPTGANVSYGPYSYANGIQTIISGINIPYGTSSGTQLTVSDAFPCTNTHGLSIPSGQYQGESLTISPSFQNYNPYIQSSTNTANCLATVNYPLLVLGTSPVVTYQFTGATTRTGSGTGSGQVFEKGVTHVTVTAINNCGNVISNFDVTVVDNVAPAAICKPATVYLNASGTATLQAIDVNNGSIDNCGPVSLSLDNSGIICGTAAEGNSLTLTAPAGLVITSINFASYGTPNGSCNNFTIGGCHASNSMSIVSGLAIGQNSVTIPASNGLFGDPCGGTVKRLFVQAMYGTSGPAITFTCSNLGANTVSLKVTDGDGNVSTCNATVTVVDNINPTILCPGPLTVECASAVPEPNTALVTASDNCSAIVTFVSDVISNQTCASNYIITRTYKTIDPSNNFATCTQTITVNDQTAPIITYIPSNTTVSCVGEVPSFNDAAVVATDNCSGSITITHADVINAGSCANRYSIARSYTATDVCGNTSSQIQTIIVNDQTAPAITFIPLNTTVSCVGEVPSFNDAAVVATDNCGGTISITHADVITAGSCANRYSIARSYTATDVCGNASSQIQTITVNDQTAPVISCPSNIVVNNAPGVCGSTVSFSATATDNCGSTTITYSPLSGSLFVVGATPVTATATDACGNSSTCTFTVIVIDNEKPVINGQNNNITMNFNAGSGAPPSYTEAGITFLSLYGGGHVHLGDNNGDSSPDIMNHSGCCSTPYRLTVGANVNYTLISMEVKQVSNPPGTFYVYPSGASVTINSLGLFTFPAGFANVTEVRWQQDAGQTVIDNMIVSSTTTGVCPANIVKSNDVGQCGAIVNYSASVTDNCSATLVFSPASGSFFPIGVTPVTATAIDPSGNTSTCSFTVRINDTQNPTISCPAPLTLQCASAVPAPNTALVTATDNCSAVVTFVSDVISNQTCANKYKITRTYKATDASGNFATCTQIITVNDNTAPVLNTLPANATVSCNAIPSAATLTATDNCDTNPFVSLNVISTQNANNTNSGHYNYTITRTWTATDNCTNSSSHTQIITVQDVTAPIITCPASVTLNCQADNTSASTGVATGTDNCSPVSITQTQTSTQNASPTNAGYYNYVITRTWTATDVAGNFSTCIQIITVQDVTVPTFTAPANITIYTNSTCAYNATVAATGDVTNEADNCATGLDATFTDVNIAGACAGSRVITRTWRLVDYSGNAATQQVQTIIVSDNIVPVITVCSTNKSVVPNNAGCAYKVIGTSWNASATDNCSTPVIKYTLSGATASATNAFTSLSDVIFNSGVTTVIVKAYDACNNVSTACTFTVTVATTLNAVSTTPNRQMYFGFSADQYSTITTAPTGGTAPYTIVYTMNRLIKCNVSVMGGNETWVASGGTSTGNICPASGSAAFPVVSTSGPISAGGSYAITIKLMANAIISATVTDAFGCVVSDTTQIWAEDVRCFAGNSTKTKVKLCHRNNGNGCVAICVDESGVQSHLDHGDFLGDCTPGCIAPPTYFSSNTIVEPVISDKDFSVQVSPNPTWNVFKIKVESKTNEKIEIRIYDVTGKTITSFSNISKGSVSTIGNELMAGTYFAEVRQGVNRKVLKLIKLN